MSNSIVHNAVSHMYYTYFTLQLLKVSVSKHFVTFIVSVVFFMKKTAWFSFYVGLLSRATFKQNSFYWSLFRWCISSSCYFYKIQERAVEHLVQMLRSCATRNGCFFKSHSFPVTMIILDKREWDLCQLNSVMHKG